jgi:hypothetical protein
MFGCENNKSSDIDLKNTTWAYINGNFYNEIFFGENKLFVYHDCGIHLIRPYAFSNGNIITFRDSMTPEGNFIEDIQFLDNTFGGTILNEDFVFYKISDTAYTFEKINWNNSESENRFNKEFIHRLLIMNESLDLGFDSSNICLGGPLFIEEYEMPINLDY